MAVVVDLLNQIVAGAREGGGFAVVRGCIIEIYRYAGAVGDCRVEEIAVIGEAAIFTYVEALPDEAGGCL